MVTMKWDGTEEDFQRSLDAMIGNGEIESDYVVVYEVLDIALRAVETVEYVW